MRSAYWAHPPPPEIAGDNGALKTKQPHPHPLNALYWLSPLRSYPHQLIKKKKKERKKEKKRKSKG